MATQTEYDQLFIDAGEKYGVDASILKGIASVESNFNPKATGPKTRSGQAQGMMQFVPAMQKAYGITDPFDPQQSVDAAARMIRDNLKRYDGDVFKALEAYNGGPRLVGKSTQTRNYAQKVQRKAQLYANSGFGMPIQVAGTTDLAPKTGQSYTGKTKAPVKGQSFARLTTNELPPSYKAALALTYLGETDADVDIMTRAMSTIAKGEAAKGKGKAVSTKGLMGVVSAEGEEDAFDVFNSMQAKVNEPEPRKMATGGLLIGGTEIPYTPGVDLAAIFDIGGATTGQESYLAARQADIARYNEAVPAYNAAMEEYIGKVNDYNTNYNNWVAKANAYNSEVDRYKAEVKAYNDAITAWKNAGASGTFNQAVPSAISAPNPGAWTQTFDVAAPIKPVLGFDPVAFQEQMTNLGKITARRKADLNRAMQIINDPQGFAEMYNISPVFANGGEVKKVPMNSPLSSLKI